MNKIKLITIYLLIPKYLVVQIKLIELTWEKTSKKQTAH